MGRVLDYIFPNFTELHYFILIFVIGAGMVFYQPSELAVYAGNFPLYGLIIAAAVLASLYILLKNKVYGKRVKSVIAAFYFLIFAILAYNAISEAAIPKDGTLFDMINFWLVRLSLLLAVIRGAIVYLFGRVSLESDDYWFFDVFDRNFDDTQFKIQGFLLATLTACSIFLILSRHYPGPATVVLLAYSYTNLLLACTRPLIGKYIAYPLNSDATGMVEN